MMDPQDRLWFAQYRGNRVAVFDTKAERFQEWEVPTPWTGPYDVALDRARRGHVHRTGQAFI